MPTYSVHEAATKPSRLIRAAERGEEVIITRDGNPVARLIPYRSPRGASVPDDEESRGFVRPASDRAEP